jgi:hypothetical protein
MFFIFVRILRISLFLGCPSKILGGITWKPQMEPPNSNSKIPKINHIKDFEDERVPTYN